jgi:hypothetical protein
MQRGMLNLAPSEITYACGLAKTSAQDIKNLLPRLESAARDIGDKSVVHVELSEDEVETLLDSLPMPSKEEDRIVTSMRAKFSQFLGQFRFKKPK